MKFQVEVAKLGRGWILKVDGVEVSAGPIKSVLVDLGRHLLKLIIRSS